MGVLAAAVFAGCGSDSSTNAAATDGASESTTSEQSTGPLTKAEFVKEANKICRAGVEKKEEAVISVAKTATASGKPPSPQAIEKVVEVVIFPTYQGILDDLAELEAPEADSAKVEQIIGKYSSDLEAAEAEPLKASKQNLFADANDMGEAFGLESCRF
jgi:hypothetical protein